MKLGIPMRFALGYGLLASLLYFVAGFTPGDGRLGAWILLYVIGWPFSRAITEVTALLGGVVPEWLFGFCYVAGVIIAGMIWVFLIALTIKYATAGIRKYREIKMGDSASENNRS